MQESFEDELDSNIELFLGKRLKMRFIDEDSSLKWYNGRIISFEPPIRSIWCIFSIRWSDNHDKSFKRS